MVLHEQLHEVPPIVRLQCGQLSIGHHLHDAQDLLSRIHLVRDMSPLLLAKVHAALELLVHRSVRLLPDGALVSCDQEASSISTVR